MSVAAETETEHNCRAAAEDPRGLLHCTRETGHDGPHFDGPVEFPAESGNEVKTRTNHDGDPCPAWCTSKHDRLVVADKPQFGYMDIHFSDYTSDNGSTVKLQRSPGGETIVRIGRCDLDGLTAPKAEKLVRFLEFAPVDMTDLIDQLRAAVSIIKGDAHD